MEVLMKKLYHNLYLEQNNFCEHQSYGSYSDAENKLLVKYGSWLNALASGNLTPTTPEQEHFISVHKGEKLQLMSMKFCGKNSKKLRSEAKNFTRKHFHFREHF